jgi:hypothetical protein
MHEQSPIRRIAFIGRGAYLNRIKASLEFPSPSVQRITIIVRDDQDVYRLYGIEPSELRYVPLDPSPHQWGFIRERGLRPITMEAAAAWVRSRMELLRSP